MIGASCRMKGDRGKNRRLFLAAPALAALTVWLNVIAPAKADEAMIEGCLKAAAEVHHLPAGVLVLLISVEGGRLGGVSQNTNGTFDIGNGSSVCDLTSAQVLVQANNQLATLSAATGKQLSFESDPFTGDSGGDTCPSIVETGLGGIGLGTNNQVMQFLTP